MSLKLKRFNVLLRNRLIQDVSHVPAMNKARTGLIAFLNKCGIPVEWNQTIRLTIYRNKQIIDTSIPSEKREH